MQMSILPAKQALIGMKGALFMNVIDSVKKPRFVQWCSKFVSEAISKMPPINKRTEIDAVEIVGLDKYHIYLTIDGRPFAIWLVNYIPTGYDENHNCCAALDTYIVFYHTPDLDKILRGEIKDHGVSICGGQVPITWSNDPELYEQELHEYRKFQQKK